MHKFGVWYFETGWLIATFIGVLIGYNANATKRPGLTVGITALIIAVIGAIALYGKYGLD